MVQPVNDRTAEQKLWKVSVLCEGLVPVRAPKGKPQKRIERRYKTVLLTADDSHAAMEGAKEYADSNAEPDVDWKCFTPLSAARFVLPMAVEDFQ